jgi:hypothetical protein
MLFAGRNLSCSVLQHDQVKDMNLRLQVRAGLNILKTKD